MDLPCSTPYDLICIVGHQAKLNKGGSMRASFPYFLNTSRELKTIPRQGKLAEEENSLPNHHILIADSKNTKGKVKEWKLI